MPIDIYGWTKPVMKARLGKYPTSVVVKSKFKSPNKRSSLFLHEYEFCLKRSGVWGGGRATWKLDPICHLAWYVVNSAEEAPKWQRTRLVAAPVNIETLGFFR